MNPMTAHTKEPLPCPFCNGSDIRLETNSNNFGVVRCLACGGSMHSGVGGEPEAITRWNQRAGLNPEAIGDVVAALEELIADYMAFVEGHTAYIDFDEFEKVVAARAAIAKLKGEA